MILARYDTAVELLTFSQATRIEVLLNSSTFDHEQRNQLEIKARTMTPEEADDLIGFLLHNQQQRFFHY